MGSRPRIIAPLASPPRPSGATATGSRARASRTSVPSSCLLHDVDRYLDRRNRSPVLEPVQGVPVLRPAHAGPIVGGDSIAMVGDRALQYVDGARPILVVVNRAED